jgi:hypothetical protein
MVQATIIDEHIKSGSSKGKRKHIAQHKLHASINTLRLGKALCPVDSKWLQIHSNGGVSGFCEQKSMPAFSTPDIQDMTFRILLLNGLKELYHKSRRTRDRPTMYTTLVSLLKKTPLF